MTSAAVDRNNRVLGFHGWSVFDSSNAVILATSILSLSLLQRLCRQAAQLDMIDCLATK